MALATAPQHRLELVHARSWVPESLDARLRAFRPQSELGKIIKSTFDYLPLEQSLDLLDRFTASIVFESSLALQVIRGCAECGPMGRMLQCTHRRDVEGYGVVGHRQVTADAVLHLVNDMAATASYVVSNFKYHGIGTGTNGEAATDTILQTELTTEYATDNTRPTGTQVAATSGNNATYTSVGTNTLDSGTPALTEHGLFNRAANGARVAITNILFDRTVFGVITLTGANGDSLASSYVWTASSGG